MELSPAFLRDLERVVGAGGVVSSREGRLTYEADMHTLRWATSCHSWQGH